VDFAANLLGAWYPVLQHEFPSLQSVNLKMSYLPRTQGEPGAIAGQTRTLMDDYEGQTFWLALTVHDVLPASMRTWWPEFLGVAVGMAVRDNLHPERRHLVWFVAPDIDLRRLIPRTTPFLRTLGDMLNFVHLPLPAVRFAPGVVWYGIYF
jgi:hypothetical protein